MNWVDPISNESIEERGDDMSSLATRFVTQMRKWAASAQGETTLDFIVPGDKRPKWSGPDEEAQKSPAVITVDSPERASGALPALEGATQDASRETCASLEDGASVEGPSNANQVVSEAPSIKIVVGPSLLARRSSLATFSARKARLPDSLVLGSYVKPMEWAYFSTDTSAPGLDAARPIIDR